jgi:serine/threonine protein kinase
MAADPELVDWLRAQIARHSGTPLGEGYQASVERFDGPFGALVVKRPHGSPLLGRAARAAIVREADAYERLAGIPGIPHSYGLIDGQLVLEYVAGESLRVREGSLADRHRFFERMLATLDAMHARGVAHGDLKRKDNTIVGPSETPYLIDFGIASVSKGGRLRRAWFRLVRQMDYNAWIKLKYGRDPESLEIADAARYKPLWIERIARWVRIPWQKLTMRRLRKRLGRRRKQES